MTNDLNEMRIAQMATTVATAAGLAGAVAAPPAETYVQFLSRVQAQAITIDAANKKADTPRGTRQVSQAQGTASNKNDNKSDNKSNRDGRGGRGNRGG